MIGTPEVDRHCNPLEVNSGYTGSIWGRIRPLRYKTHQSPYSPTGIMKLHISQRSSLILVFFFISLTLTIHTSRKGLIPSLQLDIANIQNT